MLHVCATFETFLKESKLEIYVALESADSHHYALMYGPYYTTLCIVKIMCYMIF